MSVKSIPFLYCLAFVAALVHIDILGKESYMYWWGKDQSTHRSGSKNVTEVQVLNLITSSDIFGHNITLLFLVNDVFMVLFFWIGCEGNSRIYIARWQFEPPA